MGQPSDRGVGEAAGADSNHCPLDPVTLRRLPPSGLSTFFLILFGLWATSAVCLLGLAAEQSRRPVSRWVKLGLGVACYVAGMTAYWRFYGTCRPWLGWGMLLATSVVISQLTLSLHSENVEDAVIGLGRAFSGSAQG